MMLEKSRGVEGRVWHARHHPVKHAFEYSVYFFKLDVDEIENGAPKQGLFGFNCWNVLSLHAKDYLRPGPESLREKVEGLLAEQGIFEKPKKIELITQMRYWGWVFNPVSFFYCWNEKSELFTVIADVNNTFGEGHAYVLSQLQEIRPGQFEARAEKAFHVSPFFDRKGEYRFGFSLQSEAVGIILDYYEGKELRLSSSWNGKCFAVTTPTLFSVLARYPFAGWLTLLRIHSQAVILYFFKKLPFFKKPEPMSEMTLRRK